MKYKTMDIMFHHHYTPPPLQKHQLKLVKSTTVLKFIGQQPI